MKKKKKNTNQFSLDLPEAWLTASTTQLSTLTSSPKPRVLQRDYKTWTPDLTNILTLLAAAAAIASDCGVCSFFPPASYGAGIGIATEPKASLWKYDCMLVPTPAYAKAVRMPILAWLLELISSAVWGCSSETLFPLVRLYSNIFTSTFEHRLLGTKGRHQNNRHYAISEVPSVPPLLHPDPQPWHLVPNPVLPMWVCHWGNVDLWKVPHKWPSIPTLPSTCFQKRKEIQLDSAQTADTK